MTQEHPGKLMMSYQGRSLLTPVSDLLGCIVIAQQERRLKKVYGKFVPLGFVKLSALGIDFMKPKIILFLFLFVIAACGDDKPFGKEGNINISSNDKDLQLVEALKYGSAGRAHDEIRHFHISGKKLISLG